MFNIIFLHECKANNFVATIYITQIIPNLLINYNIITFNFESFFQNAWIRVSLRFICKYRLFILIRFNNINIYFRRRSSPEKNSWRFIFNNLVIRYINFPIIQPFFRNHIIFYFSLRIKIWFKFLKHLMKLLCLTN